MDKMTAVLAWSLFLGILNVSNSRSICNDNSDCPFGGTCVTGSCRCWSSCRNAGLIPLCGDDGKYYMNLCYLQTHSCEIGREIEIHYVGYHEKCSGHRFSKYALMSYGLRHSPCESSNKMCENYGVCIADRGSTACLCPNGFHGLRCQIRRAPNIASQRRHSSLHGIQIDFGDSENTSKEVSIHPPLLLLICIFSACFSSIVTSALCQRLRIRDVKRLTRRSYEVHGEISSRSDRDDSLATKGIRESSEQI